MEKLKQQKKENDIYLSDDLLRFIEINDDSIDACHSNPIIKKFLKIRSIYINDIWLIKNLLWKIVFVYDIENIKKGSFVVAVWLMV